MNRGSEVIRASQKGRTYIPPHNDLPPIRSEFTAAHPLRKRHTYPCTTRITRAGSGSPRGDCRPVSGHREKYTSPVASLYPSVDSPTKADSPKKTEIVARIAKNPSRDSVLRPIYERRMPCRQKTRKFRAIARG